MGKAEKGRVGDFFHLDGNRSVDVRMGVAVDVGPDGGIAVEVFAVLGIVEPWAFSGGDDDGFVPSRAPIGLAGEGMPAMGLIGGDPAAGGFGHGNFIREWTRMGPIGRG